jgi:hypothetical protein
MRELAIAFRHNLCQLANEPDNRETSGLKVLAIFGAIDFLCASERRDRSCRTLRNNAKLGLARGEGSFYLEITR